MYVYPEYVLFGLFAKMLFFYHLNILINYTIPGNYFLKFLVYLDFTVKPSFNTLHLSAYGKNLDVIYLSNLLMSAKNNIKCNFFPMKANSIDINMLNMATHDVLGRHHIYYIYARR